MVTYNRGKHYTVHYTQRWVTSTRPFIFHLLERSWKGHNPLQWQSPFTIKLMLPLKSKINIRLVKNTPPSWCSIASSIVRGLRVDVATQRLCQCGRRSETPTEWSHEIFRIFNEITYNEKSKTCQCDTLSIIYSFWMFLLTQDGLGSAMSHVSRKSSITFSVTNSPLSILLLL